MVTRFTDELLDRLSQQGDPTADAVIAGHAAERPADSPARLVADVAMHLELPPAKRSVAIAEYLADHPPLPPWADTDLMERSSTFFAEEGLAIGSALFLASLPSAYACARGARVLALTARMATDPVRRIDETAQMVFEAMASDGLTAPTGAGYMACRRVRLMHAAVRRLILDDPTVAWNVAGSVPLNQEELLGTLMTFTTVVFTTLDRQGIGYKRADAEAYLHTWSVVGHLLGIQPDLLPIGWDDAWDLSASIRRRQMIPSEDGRVLADALVGAIQRSIRWRAFKGLPLAAIQWYIGDDTAAAIGADARPRIRLLFGPARAALARVGSAERHSRLVRSATERLTIAVLGDFLNRNRSGDRPPFSLPRSLNERVQSAPSRWRFF